MVSLVATNVAESATNLAESCIQHKTVEQKTNMWHFDGKVKRTKITQIFSSTFLDQHIMLLECFCHCCCSIKSREANLDCYLELSSCPKLYKPSILHHKMELCVVGSTHKKEFNIMSAFFLNILSLFSPLCLCRENGSTSIGEGVWGEVVAAAMATIAGVVGSGDVVSNG